jgi:hypothetical protein
MAYSVSDLVNDLEDNLNAYKAPHVDPKDLEDCDAEIESDMLRLISERAARALAQRMVLLEAAKAAQAVLAAVPMPLIGLERAVELLDKAIRGSV